MDSLLQNISFHHIEVPCDDLELAEQFYKWVFGASVYMRRDADRRPDVPVEGSIAEAELKGFSVDGTYLRVGDSLRIGFLKREQIHQQFELDHLAFSIDEEDLATLAGRLAQYKVEVIDQGTDRMLIRDPFGMLLELWPRSVLARMKLL
jgi:catechol 2,3-dioxygenase-like lactoylglutathione lyase family enzyme